MANTSDRTVSVFDLAEAVRRHKVIGTAAFLAIMALVVLAWIFLPREYGSEGRMVVRMGRANLGMNTTPDGARMVSIQDTRETEIRSVMDLITSEQVLGSVVDSVGAEAILSNTVKLPFELKLGGAVQSGEMSEEEYNSLLQREKAIKRLYKEMKVAHEKKSPNISIFCTGANPQLAQEIVNKIMQVVQDTHVDIHSVKRSASHFDRELKLKEAALLACQKELEQFATDNEFLSVDEARNTLNGVIDKLENELVDAGLDLRTSEAMVAELTQQAKSIEVDFDMSTIGIERSATSGARQQYYERVAEKARLESQYKGNHPKIVQINAEIEQLRQEVDALPEERVQKDKVRNPVFEEITVALIKETANVQSKKERLELVRSKLDEKIARLKEVNRLKTKSSELQRRAQLAQMEFDSYARKRNESRMVDELDKEAISDIVIQQPASLALKKVAPKGSMMLPLGVFFATVAGIAVCIFADRKKLANLTTTEEIEDAIGVPVLATLPRVHSSRVLIN